MKLTIELVPKTAWNKSLAQTLPRSVWTNIRTNYIEQKGKKCEICSQTNGIFNLHEIWSYDDIKHIQKLDRLILLCTMCHHVKHIGLTQILANQGIIDLEDIIKHFCKVNNCTKKDFQLYERETFDTWRQRSLLPWKQEFGMYEQYFRE